GLILSRASQQRPYNPITIRPWFPPGPGAAALPFLLALAPREDQFLVVHVLGKPVCPVQDWFGATTLFPRSLHIGGLAGMSPATMGLARLSPSFTWTLVAQTGELTLHSLGPA